MKDGAWIQAATGEYRWLDEHARWLQRPGNAASLGVSSEVVEQLAGIPWDFNGSGRKAILLTAMGQGLIRARGHGSDISFEHVLACESAIRGCLRFMDENLGPSMWCRFNNLKTGQCIGFLLGSVRARLDQEDLSFLLPPHQRPRLQPTVAKPFLVADLTAEGEGWACWKLPDDLDAKALVDMIRGHVPEGGGWLSLGDGRAWKVTPTTPPIMRVDSSEALRRFEICPDCGWPRIEPHTPCQCHPRSRCFICDMPIYWPVPGHEYVHLDGRVLHVAHFVAYGHKCVPWRETRILDLNHLLNRC